MLQTKTLADLLTGARFLFGLYFIWLALTGGPQALSAAALLLLASWVSDVLDGPLARRDPRGIRTWIGDHDLHADMTVGFGVWVYLGMAGYVDLRLTVAYLVLSAMALWRSQSVQLRWLLQAPPYGWMIWTALHYAPEYGVALLGWIGFVLIATWPRFPKQTLPDFIRGMKALFRRR